MSGKLKPGQVNKTVSVAGTREKASASQLLVRSFMIQALATNTNNVYIGDSSVSSTVFGIKLAAGNAVTVEAPVMGVGGSNDLDLSDWWLDVDTNGEGVSIIYLKGE